MAPKDVDLARPIKMILSDVDGVLTDGSIIIDNAGVETKAFHVRDGLGIKLWQSSGLHFGILTARNSQVVKLRAAELGIQIVRQGFSEKLPAAKSIFEQVELHPSEVCYIGDDLSDLSLLSRVGLAATVADGAAELKSVAHITTTAKGGSGAVRELIELILKSQNRWQELLQTHYGI